MIPELDKDSPARPVKSGRATLSALQRAIGLLARREHSRQELREKLLQRGHVETEVEDALRQLIDKGLQSEERFAGSLARTRMAAGHGPLRIENDLRQQALGAELIDATMAGFQTDWFSQALNVLRRKFGESITDATDDYSQKLKRRNRQLAFLLRRGFDMETAREALSRWERSH
ncbi:MAG: regulatory protein RecX [Rhodanobacteraceae bacterium]|nr:regulatory protein RecX [Xanthomonadales bacterium]MCP5478638.1 regulatory protein RecX [Rhodanobacteraceae bacterium]HPF73448.1 regulatory protein RecX [Xanthomonadaceae bacterium]HRX99843.1 regulatory protein RecX [Xanthomonadaceae bacterium]